MRTTLILTLLTLSAADATVARAANPQSWRHTRPLTPGATVMLAHATELSPIVRTLLEDLERTDIVVYLVDSMSGSRDDTLAHLRFVSRAAGTRYLLVEIDRWRLLPVEITIHLGHELQHALEVAAASEVNDAAGLADLYRRIGWEGRKDRFESAAARSMGDRVRNQVHGLGG